MPHEADDGLGNWLEYDDGSLRRLIPVPDEVRREAERRGWTLAPDFVPAEDVEKYDETRTKR